MDKELSVFWYVVYPKSILKNVPFIGEILRAGSYRLTKEGVSECLKKASVYRKFSVDNVIKVTALNLDRLHNENFISEEDWRNVNLLSNTPSEDDSPVGDIKEKDINNTMTVEEEVNNNSEAVISSKNQSDDVIEESVEETTTMIEDKDVVSNEDTNNDVIEETVIEEAVEDNSIVTEDNSDNIVTEDSTEVTTDVPANNIIDPVADYEKSNNSNNKQININYSGKKKHK